MGEKVWIRFEKMRNGRRYRLRIQDVPRERLQETIDLKLKHFVRDEIVHKATGINNNAEAIKQYTEYFLMNMMNDPESRTVICCEDDGDGVGDIMGISCVTLIKKDEDWNKIVDKFKVNGTKEMNKLIEVCYEISWQLWRPMRNLNLADTYLDDDSLVVLPDYRGLGIAEQFFKTRRLMCTALNVPKTGAWMTAAATQVAAAKAGWETVYEVKYEDLARTCNLVFENAPPTMKFMVAGPD